MTSEHPFRPITITAWRDSALAIANQKTHSPKTVRRLALRMINALDRLAVLEANSPQADRLATQGRHPSNSPFAMQRT